MSRLRIVPENFTRGLQKSIFYLNKHGVSQPRTKMDTTVEKILSSHSILQNNMVQQDHVRFVLENLRVVLNEKIPGDVVEFGCYEGTTSLFISRVLQATKSDKMFHVYDSFLGLPDKGIKDGNSPNFKTGYCKAGRDRLEANFSEASLPLPVIHEGWFKDLRPNDMPDKISFSFVDCDYYDSIMCAFKLVYPRMLSGGRIVVHDYKYEHLPGVEQACHDFLSTRPDTLSEAPCGGLAVIIKF